MELGAKVLRFTPPVHPRGITLTGHWVTVEPLDADRHGADLFAAHGADRDGTNWAYLPYGPFPDREAYLTWLRSVQDQDDPVFFAVCREGRALGVASFLRITPSHGVIEVGHIHFSPLLQSTVAATEAMVLMMAWAFDAGYRRYEWKCNALNRRSRLAAARLGLSFEGVFRQMQIVKGRNRDTAWFAAIDREWPHLRAAFEHYLDPARFDAAGRTDQSLTQLTAPLLHRVDRFEDLA